MANTFKWNGAVVVLLCLGIISIAQAQSQYGSGRGTAIRSPAAQAIENVNNGVVKALEAKIAAMEELIREYEEKGVLLTEREFGLEQNRLLLEKRMRDEEKRIREREIGLEKREAEIGAYQNKVLKDQDERERHLEILSRQRGC